ncbi:hypothetical protein PPEP_b0028 [Pseudoalteromonas peptidolytica F12-50-A1]|uniref:Uncharacterized protein n=1 Tax=Pseudoalteromonas peptidolytica F12-50-A1 TaxID=1315280 RepID=A0A8I0T5R9_9GAMM|nr:hypothetical protein [Pseudoalteromonas peptidolytica F12-50-A1]
MPPVDKKAGKEFADGVSLIFCSERLKYFCIFYSFYFSDSLNVTSRLLLIEVYVLFFTFILLVLL